MVRIVVATCLYKSTALHSIGNNNNHHDDDTDHIRHHECNNNYTITVHVEMTEKNWMSSRRWDIGCAAHCSLVSANTWIRITVLLQIPRKISSTPRLTRQTMQRRGQVWLPLPHSQQTSASLVLLSLLEKNQSFTSSSYRTVRIQSTPPKTTTTTLLSRVIGIRNIIPFCSSYNLMNDSRSHNSTCRSLVYSTSRQHNRSRD